MTIETFMWWLLSLIVAAAIGYCLVSLFWPPTVSRGLMWMFAPGMGLGVCSLIFVIFRRPMFTVEFAVLALLALAGWQSGTLRWPGISGLRDFRVPITIVCLVFACGIALSAMVQLIDRTPHGDWDAWNIWNAHSRYLYRDGPAWKENIHNTFHPDYPLLISALTARLWRYAGAETPDAGGLIGIIFTLGGVGVLTTTLIELRDRTVAVLCGLVLVATPFYVEYGVSQSADVPLSFYFLCTVALICLQSTRAPGHTGLLVLAGLTAGFAGWTKNEGQLFIPVALLAAVIAGPWKVQPALRRFSAVAAGVLIPLAVIVYIKMIIDFPSDIFGNRYASEVVAKIMAPDRYAYVASMFWSISRDFGRWSFHPAVPLLAFVILRGLDRSILRNPGWIAAAFVGIVIPAGYFVVYVITPMDLKWHVNASLPRLMLHVWPILLLVAGLSTERSDSLGGTIDTAQSRA